MVHPWTRDNQVKPSSLITFIIIQLRSYLVLGTSKNANGTETVEEINHSSIGCATL